VSGGVLLAFLQMAGLLSIVISMDYIVTYGTNVLKVLDASSLVCAVLVNEASW
jgi:hypothetical protein